MMYCTTINPNMLWHPIYQKIMANRTCIQYLYSIMTWLLVWDDVTFQTNPPHTYSITHSSPESCSIRSPTYGLFFTHFLHHDLHATMNPLGCYINVWVAAKRTVESRAINSIFMPYFTSGAGGGCFPKRFLKVWLANKDQMRKVEFQIKWWMAWKNPPTTPPQSLSQRICLLMRQGREQPFTHLPRVLRAREQCGLTLGAVHWVRWCWGFPPPCLLCQQC